MWRLLWQFRADGWHFRRQQPIGPYFADFACLHARLVIEVDGASHIDAEADSRRDDYMRGRGLHVLRFTNDDVLANGNGVYLAIAYVLEAVAATSNSPHPVPPPPGGRGPRSRSAVAEPETSGEASVGSPSPLRGGDRGGGSLPAALSSGTAT